MIREKQDGEDLVYVAEDRSFGSQPVEALRLNGSDGTVSINGNPISSQVLKAKVVILAAAVKTLHATPVQALPVAPAGKFYEIVSLRAKLVYGSAGYDAVGATDYLELRYTDASGAVLVQTISPVGFADATADAHIIIQPAASWAPLNAKVVAYIATGEWYAAAGDSDLHLEILYRLRDLAI